LQKNFFTIYLKNIFLFLELHYNLWNDGYTQVYFYLKNFFKLNFRLLLIK